LSALTLQLPADIKKEAEAKNGVTKQFLLHICDVIDNNFTSTLDIKQAILSKGIEMILLTARAACPVIFSDLI
jgi:hypothetical protein